MNSALIQRTILPLLSAGVLTAVVAAHLKPAPALAPAPPKAPPTAPGKATPQLDYQAMLGWHLFGTATNDGAANPQSSAAAPPAVIDEATLPPANVDLKLHGIAYAADRNRAYAILANPDGAQKKYRAGDTVKDDIVIESIRARGVVLKHAGRLEVLELPKESSGGANANLGARYAPPGMMQVPPNMPQMQTLNARPPVPPPAPLRMNAQGAPLEAPPASTPALPPNEAQPAADDIAAPSNN